MPVPALDLVVEGIVIPSRFRGCSEDLIVAATAFFSSSSARILSNLDSTPATAC